LLRTWLQTEIDVDVSEIFSCEATDDREAEALAGWFCNVAAKAALRILLQRKAASCKGFQHPVTL
jgi:hypothetical protein